MSKVVFVEGNIGSGKTELLGWIKHKLPSWTVVTEPIDQWSGAKPYFCERRYDFLSAATGENARNLQGDAATLRFVHLQEAVCATHYENMALALTQGTADGCFIFERNLCSCIMFAKVIGEMGIMEEIDVSIVEKLVDVFLNSLPRLRHPDLVIHVDTPPEICCERIKIRGRSAESGISLDYLRAIQGQHELLRGTNFAPLRPKKVVTLSGCHSKEECRAQLDTILQTLCFD